MRRVVVTGMAGVTSLGGDWPTIHAALRDGRSGVRYISDWERLEDLNTRLGAPADWFDDKGIYPRKKMRSMGRVAVLAVRAAERALTQAGLIDDPILRSGRVGVASGSSYGSTPPTVDFAHFIETGKAGPLSATSYIRMMSHTTPVNIAIYFGLSGRVITTSSACTSGSQGIGYAVEAIRHGYADAMIAGGAEEFCPTMAVVFDTLFATSAKNDDPAHASRPFDRDRDGLIIGEGAAMLVLEDYEHARARGAECLAEVIGFATNADGTHVTEPAAETQDIVMRLALANAGVGPETIGFVSGHAPATEIGDIAESRATHQVFGGRVPIHSLKGHFGHTLGACGAIEAWLTIEMMNEGWFAPTANLENPDSRCAELDYVVGEGRNLDIEYAVSNNFAFGGINTSIVLKRL
ncbi:MAG: beta-ketoacyl-ACP synthase [Defluviicoccus sp.]|nr:MAG: beta-ketoacyl-ACP synthase [Defluviicoccus sp.]